MVSQLFKKAQSVIWLHELEVLRKSKWSSVMHITLADQ